MTPLTRNFKNTIKARIERDPAFRKELLRERIEAFVDPGNLSLRLGNSSIGVVNGHAVVV